MIDIRKIDNITNFVHSNDFKIMFDENMSFVKEVSDFLDDFNLSAGIDYDNKTILKFSKQSMILTTILIKITSWLVVLKSVSRSITKIESFKDSKFRISPSILKNIELDENFPPKFKEYVLRSKKILLEISALDSVLNKELNPTTEIDSKVMDAKMIQDRINHAFFK